MRNIEKILEPFNLSFGKKQDIGTLLIHLRENKVTMDEAIEYLEDLKKNTRIEQEKREKKHIKWDKVALRCPGCNTIMQLLAVNNLPGNQVGENLKSQWYCPVCFFNIFSEKTVSEIIKKLER